jgi:outer membrane beta-barrel protein
MNISMQKRLGRLAPLVIGLAVTLAPLAAQAQRKSPLADAPAIRKRLELRSTRLEFGAGFGSTLNQDFYHTMMINLKLGFHFTDWLSLGGFASFGVANIATGFQDRVVETLDPNMGSVPREPTQSEATASMSKISSILGAQLEFTPFTGKYSLFGKLFAHYDFYAFLGPGFINVTPTGSNLNPCDNNTTRECAVSGLKPGGNVGLGLHTFFNQWLALNVELRDIIAQINPAGRDVNGDGHADVSDEHWSHTFMVGANLVIYLPATADISP